MTPKNEVQEQGLPVAPTPKCPLGNHLVFVWPNSGKIVPHFGDYGKKCQASYAVHPNVTTEPEPAALSVGAQEGVPAGYSHKLPDSIAITNLAPPQPLNYVQIAENEENPSCHVCGAILTPTKWKCKSCGAITEPTQPQPSAELKERAREWRARWIVSEEALCKPGELLGEWHERELAAFASNIQEEARQDFAIFYNELHTFLSHYVPDREPDGMGGRVFIDAERRIQLIVERAEAAEQQLAEARALVNEIRQLNVLACTHQERWKKLLESAEFNRACHALAEPRAGRDLEGAK